MKNNIKPIAAVLDKIIDDVNLKEPYYFYLIKEQWFLIAGETLAAVSSPVSLENKALTLKIKDEQWAKEFAEHKQEIITKISVYFNNKTEIEEIILNT